MEQNFEINTTTILKCITKLSCLGNQIAIKFNTAYSAIEDLGLSKSWVGNQYDTVTDKLNMYTDKVNRLIITSTVTIPTNLEIITKNYASADGIIIGNANIVNPTLIESISKINYLEGQIIYKDIYVDAARINFSQCFIDIDSLFNSYLQTFLALTQNDWVGAAMEQYLSVVKNFSNTATEICDNINSIIAENVSDAQNLLNSVENEIQKYFI